MTRRGYSVQPVSAIAEFAGRVIVVSVLCCSVHAAVAEDIALRGGVYEVRFRLELPHLEDVTEWRLAAICVAPTERDPAHGLGPLSDDNPLRRCSASPARRVGDAITFEIACPGHNAARAVARYVFTGDRFEGRIAMTMGGKNMTMTEVQSGRWTGGCNAAGAGEGQEPSGTTSGKPQMQH